jgi:hypothetical protein
MAHFCQLDENNVVTQVIVVANSDTADASGVEKEHIGAAFCEKLLGGTWKQTSYNGSIRKNYAGLGYTYNADIDAFVPPNPLRLGYLTKKPHNGKPQYQCLKMRVQASHPSDTHGMKQPPRGLSKVLSGPNNHPRRLYCCMERNQESLRVCSGGRGRLVTT